MYFKPKSSWTQVKEREGTEEDQGGANDITFWGKVWVKLTAYLPIACNENTCDAIQDKSHLIPPRGLEPLLPG